DPNQTLYQTELHPGNEATRAKPSGVTRPGPAFRSIAQVYSRTRRRVQQRRCRRWECKKRRLVELQPILRWDAAGMRGGGHAARFDARGAILASRAIGARWDGAGGHANLHGWSARLLRGGPGVSSRRVAGGRA